MDLALKNHPLEVEIGASMMSLQKAMESQKELFHRQIDQLRNVVVTQCKLTGVNPLAQEMAAAALSIKIGKRPRDLLNLKAVKYMQAVFSIKDAISKKESREIGALFGLNVTQVREYFASQRTRVRKIVRISREKAVREIETKEFHDGVSAEADPMLLVEPVPLQSIAPPTAEEAPSCSNQDEVLPGLGEFDKHFVENIFSLMRKEESFSGQVKLMEWILRIENPSVLSWFLSKDGVITLDTWLSQAASEEQTSVLFVVLKVLCHLPLNKALPVHMSVILQGVNRLRFYRVADISNRARVLLSKWSKMFAKSQALKKLNGKRTSESQQEIDLGERLDELVGDGSWQCSLDNPEGNLVPYTCPDDSRKAESQEDVNLLTASSDDLNRKHILGTSTNTKERRKVQLVEQPGQKTASKSMQVKAVTVNQARPITADEIQKAKMRAHYMQSKTKTEGLKKLSLLTNDFLSASEAYLRPKLEAQKKARLLPPKSIKQEEPPNKQRESSKKQEEPPCNQKSFVDQKESFLDNCRRVFPNILKQEEPLYNQKPIVDQKESLLDKCHRVQILWQAPTEVQLNSDWGVGTGENSKEIEVQKNRTRREKVTFYRTIQEVPLNPKEPWDIEMDYDDTLTPEIPIEQLPETDNTDDTQIPEAHNFSGPSETPASTSSNSGTKPDLELLAVLLKNPELVFALTSGQASGLSGEDTVKLLDMIKSNGGLALLNGQASKPEVKEVEVSPPSPTPARDVWGSLPSPTPPSRTEVSLPSPTPTPSSNPEPNGWTLETANNPFSRHTITGVVTAQFTSPPAILSLSHLSSQHAISVSGPSSLTDSQSTMCNPALNQTLPSNYHHLNPSVVDSQLGFSALPERFPSYSRSQSEYQVIEDINMRLTKPSNQNVYDPIMRSSSPVIRPGFSMERNEVYPGVQIGRYESWSPENSHNHVMHAPPEHGHGWSYPDQRNLRGQGLPLDRLSRDQNFSDSRDRSWQGGGVNQRWNGGDCRR